MSGTENPGALSGPPVPVAPTSQATVAPPSIPDVPFICTCDHCNMQATFVAPALVPSATRFAVRCFLDCKRIRVFDFVDGEISAELGHVIPPYCKDLVIRGARLRELAESVVGASELRLVAELSGGDPDAEDSALRGAAIHLRVAAESAVAYALDLGIKQQRRLQLRDMKDRVKRGDASKRLKSGRQTDFLQELDWLRNLGDTAAHPLLKQISREIPATPGNLVKGFERLKTMLDCVEFRPALRGL
jgi:hypothetical protein